MSIPRIPLFLGGLAVCLSLSACLPDKSFFVHFEDNCLNNGGDSYCTEQDPSTPYCVALEGRCYEDLGLEATRDEVGCVAEMPEQACWAPCGLDDDSCIDTGDASSSTGDDTESPPTSSTTEPETDTEGPNTTTGPECTEDVPCMDAELPFCVDGTCSTCEASVDPTPDEACASLDVGLPLCVDTECVQCSAEDASACDGTTPLCDEANSTCVGCEFHEQCQDLGLPACNIATGACFSNDAVTTVNLSGANALQNAVNGVADGAEHAIIVTGSAASNHSAVVDGGKTIAIVSTDTSIQTIRGAGGSPTLTVTGAGSVAYLHRVRVEDSNNVGVSVESSGVLYADNTQVVGNDGGGIELAAGTSASLRNCMVAGVGGEASAISSSGTLSLLYSTLGLNTNFGDPVLVCSGGGGATARNSLIVSETNTPGDEISCPGVALVSTAVESTTTPEDWFGSGFASGDYFLNAAGQTEFADEATWEDGDPPFDFDGDLRPNTDGASDFAGADTVP